MANNENIFQGNDIINDIYKDKLTKRENNKLKVEQNNNNLNPSTNTKNLNLFSLQEIDLAQSSQLQSSNNGSPILSPKEVVVSTTLHKPSGVETIFPKYAPMCP